MKVVVVYASRHGATVGIADHIVRRLRAHRHDAEIRSVDEAVWLDGCDAAVIGSAVYFGSWLKEAAEFVRANRTVLAKRPVWLFSSGPTGDATVPEPKEATELAKLIGARGHRTFAGAINPARLSMRERLIVSTVNAPVGDFRDWNDVDRWADRIADALVAEESVLAGA